VLCAASYNLKGLLLMIVKESALLASKPFAPAQDGGFVPPTMGMLAQLGRLAAR